MSALTPEFWIVVLINLLTFAFATGVLFYRVKQQGEELKSVILTVEKLRSRQEKMALVVMQMATAASIFHAAGNPGLSKELKEALETLKQLNNS